MRTFELRIGLSTHILFFKLRTYLNVFCFSAGVYSNFDVSEGFDTAELEKKITALEQRFLETTTTGVQDPKSDVIDLLSQLRHRTNNIVHRIVTRPNLRSLPSSVSLYIVVMSAERGYVIARVCHSLLSAG